MNFERLRELILERAIQGKLVPQLESEPGVAKITARPKEPPFDIPEKWKWAQLKNVGKIVGGGTPKTNIAENWENGQILWFTPSDLGKVRGLYAETSARKITLTGLQSSAATMMPKDTVLFSSRAPIGHIALAPADCCTNQGCKSFVANSSYILPLWAYWVLANRKDDIISRASGTTFKEISLKGMSETWIPVPPIQEQHRIISKIQKLLRFVDSAEMAFRDLQLLSGVLHRRVLHLAIQGRLVPQLESEPASEPDLPISSGSYEVPKNWRLVPLKYLGIIRTGTTPSTECAEYYGTDIPFVKPGDILNGKIFYRQEGLSNNARSVARVTPPESILMVCIGGSIGKTAITDREVSFNQQINAITCFKGVVSSEYLSYVFHSNYFQKEVRSKSSGTATPIINKSRWESIVVPLPPIREQALIAIKISKIFNLMRKIMK